jgi:hypothetical protein
VTGPAAGGGPVKVLYIAGAGRSGSTLLGLILGQLEGFCYVGEAGTAWRTIGARLCGCGVQAESCGFWTAVRRRAGGDRALAPDELLGFARLARWRHLPGTFGARPRVPSRNGLSWADARRLYQALAAVSGARVIVDSTKSPVYGRMLGLDPELDVRVVHLVRDSRGVAHSWARFKVAPDRPGDFGPRPIRTVARFWMLNNLGAELFCRRAPRRYRRLHYEELVRRPRESLERILDLAGEGPRDLPLADARTLRLAATHSVKGNPGRLRLGSVALRLDEEWRWAMPRADRCLTTAITWPLLLRYGYLGRRVPYGSAVTA